MGTGSVKRAEGRMQIVSLVKLLLLGVGVVHREEVEETKDVKEGMKKLARGRKEEKN